MSVSKLGPLENVFPCSAPPQLLSIFDAPAEQLPGERVLLYALVLGLRPSSVLEIGTHWGGSTMLLCAALEDAGGGGLVSIDPLSRVPPDIEARISPRGRLLVGRSPDVLPKAARIAGQPFDFVHVDGDHSYFGAMSDLEGVLPHLADEAYLALHDAHYLEVRKAIDEAVHRYQGQLTDCGILTRVQAPDEGTICGEPVAWGGIRLLRFQRGQPTRSTLDHLPLVEMQLKTVDKQLKDAQAELARVYRSWRWRVGSAFARPPLTWLARLLGRASDTSDI